MGRWRCPSCGREFGRTRQGHTCSSGCTVDSVLRGHPDWMGEAYDAVLTELRQLGPVHEDAVSVGVFLKAERTAAEFRPKVRVVHLIVNLPAPTDHRRLARLRSSASRPAYSISLRGAADVDDEVRGWLRLAYDQASA